MPGISHGAQGELLHGRREQALPHTPFLVATFTVLHLRACAVELPVTCPRLCAVPLGPVPSWFRPQDTWENDTTL